MTSVENEEKSIPDLLYIAEQNLRLINEMKPYFKKENNLYVIIAREVNFKNGLNNGDLRTGIIKIVEPNNYELILPFSKNLLYATLKGSSIDLAYVEDMHLKRKTIMLNNEGKLNYEDYAFLLDVEDQCYLKSRSH